MDQLQQSVKDWATTLTGETLVLSVLGKIIYSEPDSAWIDPFIQEDIFSEAPFGAEYAETQQGLEILSHWTHAQQNALSATTLSDLQSDYTALFCGPGKMLAPVWESVYFTEERLVFQQRTLEVRRWYQRFGLEPEHIYAEPDDHIGLELTFMAHLAGLTVAALDKQDQLAFNQLIDAQKEFFKQHLMIWGLTWAKQVTENAKTDFYRGAGWLTYGAVLAIADLFSLKIPTEAHA